MIPQRVELADALFEEEVPALVIEGHARDVEPADAVTQEVNDPDEARAPDVAAQPAVDDGRRREEHPAPHTRPLFLDELAEGGEFGLAFGRPSVRLAGREVVIRADEIFDAGPLAGREEALARHPLLPDNVVDENLCVAVEDVCARADIPRQLLRERHVLNRGVEPHDHVERINHVPPARADHRLGRADDDHVLPFEQTRVVRVEIELRHFGLDVVHPWVRRPGARRHQSTSRSGNVSRAIVSPQGRTSQLRQQAERRCWVLGAGCWGRQAALTQHPTPNTQHPHPTPNTQHPFPAYCSSCVPGPWGTESRPLPSRTNMRPVARAAWTTRLRSVSSLPIFCKS